MSKKGIFQIVAIILLIVAVVCLIPNTDWTKKASIWGFASLVFGTIGSIVSIFIPTNYTLFFSEADWKLDQGTNEYGLTISANKHGLGRSPKVQLFFWNNSSFEVTFASIHHDENGNICILSNKNFIGKVLIN